MASITLILTSVSLNALWSKNVGLKSSDQGYICCTEDAKTGSPAQSVVVRGNYSQGGLQYFSPWVLLFGKRREEEKRGKKSQLRRGGMADPLMNTLPWAAGTATIPLSCGNAQRTCGLGTCPRPCHTGCFCGQCQGWLGRAGSALCRLLCAFPHGSPRVSHTPQLGGDTG